MSHSEQKWMKWRYLLLGGMFVLVVLPFLMTSFLRPSTDANLSDENKRTEYSYNIALTRINIPENLATVTLQPVFSGNVGEATRNGSLSFYDIELLVDSFQGDGKISSQVGELLGRKEFQVLLSGDTWLYPFDKYASNIVLTDSKFYNTRMSFREIKEYLPGFKASSKTEPTYIPSMYPKGATNAEKIKSDIDKGNLVIKWGISRLPGDIYAALLLAILMIISGFSSILVTRAVWSGRRPPSINALAWLAAFLFAMFQIRASLPGDPPNGTLFDLLIFYPILIVLLSEMAIVVYLWVKRDDWDLKNVFFTEN
jgi:hypothetical protein